MMLLAGLMGMMAVGATAFLGFDDEALASPDDDAPPERDPSSDASGDDAQTVPGIMDIALSGVSPGAADDANGTADSLPWSVDQGGDGDDTVTGTAAGDMLHGYAGDDLISGLGGDDDIRGGAGADLLSGNADDDMLHGGDGPDTLSGGEGADELFGHGGDDVQHGGAGDDMLQGGEGDDELSGGHGADALHGGLGNDTLTGGPGPDSLFGGWGDDLILGHVSDPGAETSSDMDERDFLNGGGGDDLIIAGPDDMVTPGAGADTVALGDWLSQDHQAEILGFSAEDDKLMIIYDDSQLADPLVSLQEDEDDADTRHVMLEGVRIAAVHDAPGLSLDHVVLVGQGMLEGLTA